jgi:hypothetical protein
VTEAQLIRQVWVLDAVSQTDQVADVLVQDGDRSGMVALTITAIPCQC